MNWLERYTFAVKAYLPQDIKNDVATELLSDLQDECDHRAEIQGRELTEDEIKALLRERGHPMTVAAGFQPRRTLVSESLFPLYSLILKWSIIVVAIFQGVTTLLSMMGQSDPNYVAALLQLGGGTFESGLYVFAWLTLIFYVAGESFSKDIFKNWRPESLPKVTSQGERISQTGSIFELIICMFLLAWLNQAIPNNWDGGPLALIFSDQWTTLLPWINVTLLAAISLHAVKLWTPYWTRRKILAEWFLYIPEIVLLIIISGWGNPLSVMMGSGEGAYRFDIPSQWIAIGVVGYLVVALMDAFDKARKFSQL